MGKNNLILLYEERWKNFIDEINGVSEKAIFGILGPKGTSSEYAMRYLMHELEIEIKCKIEIIFFDSFKEMLTCIEVGKVDFVLIPAAYEKNTRFFWNTQLSNLFMFSMKTPGYGVACRKRNDLRKKKNLYIATCPAVRHLIKTILKSNVCYTEVITNSTSEAAAKLVTSEVDLAITNKTSVDYYNKGNNDEIIFISNIYYADIVWIVFGGRKENGVI